MNINLVTLLNPLKDDLARCISAFGIIGFGFTWVAYSLGGEEAFEKVFASLISSEPLYKRLFFGTYFFGVMIDISSNYLICKFKFNLCLINKIAVQLRGNCETLFLLLAGTSLTGVKVLSDHPAEGNPDDVLEFCFFFLFIYALSLCGVEYLKKQFSTHYSNGDRNTTNVSYRQ
ncbi:hypothetical protein [Dickeya oryzae]|uniref:Uncharacterized protein n=1 Tax=Dickeya oryzae TaxID=1240404 RepID=A0AB39ICN1_9GAMM|nr:hypothetical protein [Dickeya oryzae]MBP2844106.1 hypothetical protein [Dickeya oryzae]MCA6993677.1 hypothetical protein [Dickeya oryzae]